MTHDPKTPRCLIGTLYSGKNELEACEAAIRSQDYQRWQAIRLDYRSEANAHRELYEAFVSQVGSYDYFIKIDADMVLRGRDCLRAMIDRLRRRRNVDHGCFAVQDGMTNQPMMGLHVFSNRVTWHRPESRHHPDQKPSIPGRRVKFWGSPAPIADHAPQPTRWQAFHFGAHRTLKAILGKHLRARRRQWNVLHQIYRHAQWNADPRLRLALLGGWHVWNGEIDATANNYDNVSKRWLYDRYRGALASTLERALPAEWCALLKRCKQPTWAAYSKRVRRLANRLALLG